jgi:hypothetical protein
MNALHDIDSRHTSDGVSTSQSIDDHFSLAARLKLYPAIIGVFTWVNVDIRYAPPQGCLLDVEVDTSNTKLMVFQTGKGSCRLSSMIQIRTSDCFWIRLYVHPGWQ